MALYECERPGCDWTEKGCQLSIPPFYTQHIGQQLAAHINAEAAA